MFEFGAKLTVTAIKGGKGYSLIPDTCEVFVDVRLTPSFDKSDARTFIKKIANIVDKEYRTHHSTKINEEESWWFFRKTCRYIFFAV